MHLLFLKHILGLVVVQYILMMFNVEEVKATFFSATINQITTASTMLMLEFAVFQFLLHLLQFFLVFKCDVYSLLLLIIIIINFS